MMIAMRDTVEHRMCSTRTRSVVSAKFGANKAREALSTNA